MNVNLYLENKDNLIQTEIIEEIDGINLDTFRGVVLKYLIKEGITDIKYKISIDIKGNKKELNITFENDTLLLREFKLKKLFEND
jgi:hypothetical protein